MTTQNQISNCKMANCVFDFIPFETHFVLSGDCMNFWPCTCPRPDHGFKRKELAEYLGPSHPIHPDWKPKR